MCKSSFTRIANWCLTGEAWGKLDWQGTGTGMKLTNQTIVEPGSFEAGITAATDTDPETEYTLHLTVADNNMGVLLAKILYYTDEEHREYETLESAELMPGTNEISLNFTAPADSVWLLICRPAEEGIDAKGKTLTVISATMYKYNWTVSQLFVGNIGLQLNPYRFAYNGQERMDEKAGRANHYTAKFWEYDPRKAVRENQDPKTAYGWSPYAVFGNNPIFYNDPLGDEKKKFADFKSGKEKASDFDFNNDEVEMDEVFVTPGGGKSGGVGLGMSSLGKKGGSGQLFGGSGNLNIWQAAERNIGRNDANRKKVDDFNSFMKGFMVIGGGIAAAPAAIGSGLFGFSADLWLTKAGLSWGSQALINGVNEVDYADMLGDAFTAPGLNMLWSGGVDFKPFAKTNFDVFRVQGLYKSKSATQFGIDAGIGSGFGIIGDAAWKPLGNMLKTPTEKSVFYISTQSAISVGQQGAGRIISNQQK